MDFKRNNSPPQLLILLWHHFCYYKRHWIKLLLTILAPILLLSLLYVGAHFLNKSFLREFTSRQTVQECYEEQLLPSAGPMEHLLQQSCGTDGMYDEYGYRHYTNRQDCSKTHFVEDSKFQSILDGNRQLKECIPSPQGDNEYWRCGITILYYPNGKLQQSIMKRVQANLDARIQFYEKGKQLETYGRVGVNLTHLFSRFGSCDKESSQNIFGFSSKEQMLQFNETEQLLYNDRFYGAVEFDITDYSAGFTLLYDKRSVYRSSAKSKRVFLQDMIQWAIAEEFNRATHNTGLVIRQLPTPCRKIVPSFFFYFLKVLIPMLAAICFISSPSNFLEQVLTEKSLKLREYLYIMGVNPWILKFSWVLFYLLFLIPLSIIFAASLRSLPGGYLALSNPALVFIIVIMYNISQLCFCYMLAAALKEPTRSTVLIGFINMFCLIIAITNSFYQPFTGGNLLVARLCSLYPITPLVYSFAYMLWWEELWLGVQLHTIMSSPDLRDGYGGVGECLLWFLAQIFLFLLIAWYLENVFPGDYGIKRKWYFPIQSSYWRPKNTESHITSFSPQRLEHETFPQETGIVLKNLTKDYGTTLAVNQLNLNFNKNEVTGFLGQNGAGKSTTMNILVGLISSTDGKATILGLDCQNQITQVRKIIAFVPQYDILYPSMTVEEHLQFYGWLKGMSKAETAQRIDQALSLVQLQDHKKNITTTLSGGQKRKLSIITAYFGDPKVVILDEPTSGVDPFSRRAIWDMVLSKRRKATTIISTHSMEEADILSDRIAIIAQGELKCNGTALYLKNRYGQGFRLTVACDPQNEQKQIIKDFISTNAAQAKLIKDSGLELTFSIPIEWAHQSSAELIQFLEKLENNQQKLAITAFGLSEPTLEEVFFSATEAKTDTDAENTDNKPGELRNEGVMMQELNGETEDIGPSSDQLRFSYLNGWMKIIPQAVALLLKRVYFSIFTITGYMLQLVLPLTFIVLLLLMEGAFQQSKGVGQQKVHIYQPYRENLIFVSGKNQDVNDFVTKAVKNGFAPRCPHGISEFSCDSDVSKQASDKLLKNSQKTIAKNINCSCNDICTTDTALNQPHQQIPSKDTLYRLSYNGDINAWALQVNETGREPVGGINVTNRAKQLEIFWKKIDDDLRKTRKNKEWLELAKKTTPKILLTVWYKSSLQYALVNIVANLIYEGDRKIHTSLEQITYITDENKYTAAMYEYARTVIGGYLLILCFGFATFGTIVFVQLENTTGQDERGFMGDVYPL